MKNSRLLAIESTISKKITSYLQKYIFNLYPNSLISLTAVKVSADIKYIKIYISIFKTPNHIKQKIMKYLDSKVNDCFSYLNKQLKTKNTPKITWILDDFFENTQNIMNIIKQIENE